MALLFALAPDGVYQAALLPARWCALTAPVQRFSRFVRAGELLIEAADEGIVSVFSLSDVATGVCEEGLKYGLDHVALTNRTSWGLSNELAGAAARISVESGTLVVFLPL